MAENDFLVKHVWENNDTRMLQSADFNNKLAEYINELILHNFDHLIFLFYRIDISEQKLKKLLKEHEKADAGKLIASMIIERQLQKIKSRQDHAKTNNDIIDEGESW